VQDRSMEGRDVGDAIRLIAEDETSRRWKQHA
jgi:hypothetical protein